MSLFFTSDTHFGIDSKHIIKREMRPFKSPSEYFNCQINIWNKQANKNDIIYHIGDFCNYNQREQKWSSGLKAVKQVKAKIILVIGNNEERVISLKFNDNFENFKKYCLDLGFLDVVKETELIINDRKFYLNHYPTKHKKDCINLFGHTHRQTGIWKPFGLNVGTDLNHFRLYSEKDIFELLEYKEKYWDYDEELKCME